MYGIYGTGVELSHLCILDMHAVGAVLKGA